MSAARRLHPESEEFASVASTSVPHEDSVAGESQPNWRDYHDRFATPERVKPRSKRARHRHFYISTSVVVGSLLMAELVAVVWIYALDLKTIRHSNQLDRDIKGAMLQISLNKDRLAMHNATPHLSQWAEQLSYRKAQAYEMDDVTSNAPVPAITPQKDAP